MLDVNGPCKNCDFHLLVIVTTSIIINARRYASAAYAVVVSPSVCLSVTRRYCTKIAKLRITQTRPYDSPGTYAKSIGEILT